jgi:anti-anti-sigma factor
MPPNAEPPADAVRHRSFEVLTEASGDAVVITVNGELDIATCPELAAALALQAAHGRSILLDLRGVEFMDSIGLRLLLHGRERAAADGRGFELMTGEAVDHTLETVGLTEFFARRPVPG